MNKFDEYETKFNTGDLILFDENHFWTPLGPFSYLIKYFTNSNWSHIGMIVKNPSFTDHELPEGIYLWESSLESGDAEDHKTKLAVQLVPLKQKLESFKGIVHWRKLNPGSICLCTDKLREIHSLVHGKPYDLNPVDWIEALLERVGKPSTVRYFCSALVARIYCFVGLLPKDTDWSIIRPSSFSEQNLTDKLSVKLLGGATLDPEVEIQNN